MGRKKTYVREEVCRRAMQLFWHKGFEGSRLQELVEVCGINRFSLYNEFGGKEGLFREAVQLYMGDIADLGEILSRKPLGLDNILAMFRAETRERFGHGCFALNTLIERHVIPEDVFAAIAGMVKQMEAGMRRNLRAAQRAGEISASHSAQDLARLVAALNIGLLHYEISNPGQAGRRGVLRSLEKLLG